MQSAYLTGYVTALKGLKEGVSEAVVDLGLQTAIKNSRIYACVKGALDAGLKVSCSEEVLPSDELLKKEELKSVIKEMKGEFK